MKTPILSLFVAFGLIGSAGAQNEILYKQDIGYADETYITPMHWVAQKFSTSTENFEIKDINIYLFNPYIGRQSFLEGNYEVSFYNDYNGLPFTPLFTLESNLVNSSSNIVSFNDINLLLQPLSNYYVVLSGRGLSMDGQFNSHKVLLIGMGPNSNGSGTGFSTTALESNDGGVSWNNINDVGWYNSAPTKFTFSMTIQASTPPLSVPEPSTYTLFGIGTIGILMVMRRKKTA